MIRNFCTLFDYNYFTKGLLLIDSLLSKMQQCSLTVLSMDVQTEGELHRWKKFYGSRLKIVPLRRVAQAVPKVSDAVTNRSHAEFCWTMASVFCHYLLSEENGRPDIARNLTYVDADTYFFRSPEDDFTEMHNHSIGIIPHRFPPRLRWREKVNGRYNVSWVTFIGPTGADCAMYWADNCLKDCSATICGDQKYLDEWANRYPGQVREFSNDGLGAAPWNIEQYHIQISNTGPVLNGHPLVMYHFHELDLIFSDQATPPGKYVPVAPGIDFRITKGYPIPRMAVEHIYKPYLQRFCELQLARHKILNGGDRWLRD